ncbi:MAG: ferritin [Sedimentisphaerales bacterium]|nr:ferritin [Sedimentisphaerales bacterium]
MISKKMRDALNSQVNAELYSAYLYLAMEAYFQSVNLPGFAKWMRAQTQEEVSHAMRIYDFINDRGGRVMLEAIARPTGEWKSPLAVFEAASKHEQKVTGLINDLIEMAIKEKDHATDIFLQWFVTEQVEEEKNASEIVAKLQVLKDSAGSMYMLDKELGKRTFASEGGE